MINPVVPDPSEVGSYRDWVKGYTVRCRPAIGAAAMIVAWWPPEERDWVKRRVQDDMGLNDVEMDEVHRIARFMEDHHPDEIDHSDTGFCRYLDIVEAAQELAFIARNVAMDEEQAQLIFARTLGRYCLGDQPDHVIDRVVALVAFFCEWPPLIVLRWERRKKQRDAATHH